MQALWMVLASFLFATMGVGIKVASASFSTAELVFYRGVVSVLFMGLILYSRGISMRTPVPVMHFMRSLVGVLSLGCWFYAIAHLPLATAMTLNYMSSVWIGTFIVGGAILYKQGKMQGQGPLLVTVLSAFAGVVMLLRPTLDHNQLFAGMIGLLAGMVAALAYLQVTALGKVGEPEGRTVFYFSLATVLAGGLGMGVTGMAAWSDVSWQALAWLVPIGVLATLGQWCMTRAYSRGSTLLVANLQYSGIVFSAIYSLTLFGDHITLLGWAGMVVIVLSGLAATVLRTRALPDTPPEEH
jgi:S-adenosylmethionine uptake transporter